MSILGDYDTFMQEEKKEWQLWQWDMIKQQESRISTRNLLSNREPPPRFPPAFYVECRSPTNIYLGITDYGYIYYRP